MALHIQETCIWTVQKQTCKALFGNDNGLTQISLQSDYVYNRHSIFNNTNHMIVDLSYYESIFNINSDT